MSGRTGTGRTGADRTGTALVVVDLQNDFCTGQVARARFGGDGAVLEAVVANSVLAVERARRAGVEVVFVRFLGDTVHQGAAWRARDRRLGKRPKCLEGTWGAEFHGVAPEPGERVFTKRACFDAFLGEGEGEGVGGGVGGGEGNGGGEGEGDGNRNGGGLEEHLRASGTGHLVLAGLYADVCVDSTARTAFQKGFHLTVLTDCTTSLHLPHDDVLRFMRVLYGARTTTGDDPAAWTVPVDGEEPCTP
ncbi:isochorismatase family cysteine hydrolase [Kitasatospora sp. NPDC096204]|uniref:isochorismatase family cysteine hydrolase n=1 Tax=Kitasatospora sp. NPDC096204 TaxID=3364094 RepID=UPI003811DB3C